MNSKLLLLLLCSISIIKPYFFHRSLETLESIQQIIRKKEKGVYLRFGDGDINLACNADDCHQKSNPQLGQEMRDVFKLHGPNILKCLPLHCKELGGWEPGMFPGNHEWSFEECKFYLAAAQMFWNHPLDDVYCMVALSHAAIQHPERCIEFLKFIKTAAPIVLIGNENIPVAVREALFGKGVIFIPAPADQSYSSIDDLEHDCLEAIKTTGDYTIIVTSMGCAGRVLQKRLWMQLDDVFLFDFGSLMDALCGWATRQWIKDTKFNPDTILDGLSEESNIKIIFTAALLPLEFESRKQEYIKSLNQLRNYGHVPYIVEACTSNGPTFLDNYSSRVCYSKVNDYMVKETDAADLDNIVQKAAGKSMPEMREVLKDIPGKDQIFAMFQAQENKGVNEVKSLRELLKRFDFKDDDIILKLTGRYHFIDDSFLRTIEQHPECDVFVKGGYGANIYTGCMAMRANYFKQFINSINLDAMRAQKQHFETLAGRFVDMLENNGIPVMRVPKLNVAAKFFHLFPGNNPVEIW